MDYFAVLEEQRRPWLDPEALRNKFLAKSAAAHPDRVHAAGEAEKQTAQKRFTEINQAYQRLRDPKERLQHLIELETGAPPAQVQRVPAELMDLAMSIGQLCKQADAFLEEKAKATSPLLQVGLFQRSREWIEKLSGVQKQIEARREQLNAELRRLDSGWDAAGAGQRPNLVSKLEELYRLFSYYGRWGNQLLERLARLSF